MKYHVKFSMTQWIQLVSMTSVVNYLWAVTWFKVIVNDGFDDSSTTPNADELLVPRKTQVHVAEDYPASSKRQLKNYIMPKQ